jgi:hypothetical protein
MRSVSATLSDGDRSTSWSSLRLPRRYRVMLTASLSGCGCSIRI